MSGTGAIILAAGNSSRLGEPKQLLRHHGQTLGARAAQAAVDAGCAPVCIVLADARMDDAVVDVRVRIARNSEWPRGIGTSIRRGLEACLLADPALDAVAILVCDQPAVDASIVAIVDTVSLDSQLKRR